MQCSAFVPFTLHLFPAKGPLLPENLDVLDILHEQLRELSVNLCGKDMPFFSENGNIS